MLYQALNDSKLGDQGNPCYYEVSANFLCRETADRCCDYGGSRHNVDNQHDESNLAYTIHIPGVENWKAATNGQYLKSMVDLSVTRGDAKVDAIKQSVWVDDDQVTCPN